MAASQHIVGISFTILVHVGAVVGMAVLGDAGAEAADEAPPLMRTIEAGLARKSTKKKTRQPQKRRKQKQAPPKEVGVSRDENKKVPEAKKDEKKPPKAEDIDINGVLDRNRQLQEEDLPENGTDEAEEGTPEGSEWGTEKDARGDPYVGELRGRVEANYSIPSLEKGTGSTLACVRLSADGKIAERLIRKKSSNSNLNRAVEIALNKATDMETPVPEHLKRRLTKNGICFNFKL